MKKNILITSLALAAFTLTSMAETSPGFVEFGKFKPPGNGAEYVEVQLRSNLLNLASRIVAKEEPDAAKLIKSVELIQVRVVGITPENSTEITKRLENIRTDLESNEWERNVSVQGKNGENVAVFTKTKGAESIAGIAVTVKDEKHIVLVNLVGDIKPEQIAALGESLNIAPLKEAGAAIKKEAK
jgi:hypothetical protein